MNPKLLISNREQTNICATCGTRYGIGKNSGDACPVCMDDGQYIGDQEQQWTSYEQL